MIAKPEKDRILDEVAGWLKAKKVVRITLSRPVHKKSGLKNVYVRPVRIRGLDLYSFTYRHPERDEVKNHDPAVSREKIGGLLEHVFRNMHVYTLEQDLEVRIDKNGTYALKTSAPSFTSLPEVSHDRKKKRWITTADNRYLRELGVTDPAGRVIPSKADKFRQIQKFVEIIDGLMEKVRLKQPVHVTDMGSGKGYLTFALYDHLVHNRNMDVRMRGVEQRPGLVTEGDRIAAAAGFGHLEFMQGSILDHEPGPLDVLIALHACDTATDDAIFMGMQSQASLILTAPCCHKQVRRDMEKNTAGSPVLDYGILMERQAEILTDAIRALIMNYYGYETQIFEFVSTEHTPKNVMISGIYKGKPANRESILEEIGRLKAHYGIQQHYLETLIPGS
ncbi:MAG: SAM-dependent methyltransferase [Bacteroidales bacterium]